MRATWSSARTGRCTARSNHLMGRFTSILSLVDNKRLPKKIKPLFFLFFFSPGSLHSWVLWTRPLSPPGATQRLVQSVQGLSKKHNLDKYTSRANDACISDYFTKSEFSANSRRERVENQRLKLFLVSEFQIPAKANRGPEENLKKKTQSWSQDKVHRGN